MCTQSSRPSSSKYTLQSGVPAVGHNNNNKTAISSLQHINSTGTGKILSSETHCDSDHKENKATTFTETAIGSGIMNTPKGPTEFQEQGASITGNSLKIDLDKPIQSRTEALKMLQDNCNSLIQELSLTEKPKIGDLALEVSDEERETAQKEVQEIIKKHIQQLKQYNELKDLALDLIGLIADQKHVRIKDLLNEMGIDPNDDNEKHS